KRDWSSDVCSSDLAPCARSMGKNFWITRSEPITLVSNIHCQSSSWAWLMVSEPTAPPAIFSTVSTPPWVSMVAYSDSIEALSVTSVVTGVGCQLTVGMPEPKCPGFLYAGRQRRHANHQRPVYKRWHDQCLRSHR